MPNALPYREGAVLDLTKARYAINRASRVIYNKKQWEEIEYFIDDAVESLSPKKRTMETGEVMYEAPIVYSTNRELEDECV